MTDEEIKSGFKVMFVTWYVRGFITALKNSMGMEDIIEDFEGYEYWEEWDEDQDLHIYFDMDKKDFVATLCKTENVSLITEDCIDIEID